jgi:hypothetical protein
MKKIAIYLAGGIKKDHEKTEDSFWTETHMNLLKSSLNGYSISFLNPAFRTDDLSDQHSVFGRDMTQVFCSDIVFVDARERRGLGVGAEMMWAKFHNIPVVTWAPKNSHYNKGKTALLGVPVENFIHPFVLALSDKIVETLEEGADWIHLVKSNPTHEIKGIEHIKKAMEYYKENQLHLDQPMQKMLQDHGELKDRVMQWH